MLWIDAFCIDQSPDKESTAELSAQMPRMTSIYMNADAIEIWLGAEENGSAMAMDELNLLADTVRDKIAKPQGKNGAKLWRDFLSLSVNVDEETYELNEVLTGSTKDSAVPAAETAMKPFVANAINSLWTRPWWDRLWVVQEATVPGFKKVLRCGDRSISWLQLMLATGSLRNSFTERLIVTERVWTIDRMRLFATTHLELLFRCGADPMRLLLVQQEELPMLKTFCAVFCPCPEVSRRQMIETEFMASLVWLQTSIPLNLPWTTPSLWKRSIKG